LIVHMHTEMQDAMEEVWQTHSFTLRKLEEL